METAVKVNREHPVLVDKYLLGKEMEVDAVSDGETVVIPGIMQHIERAGIHSGDSMAVFPSCLLYTSSPEGGIILPLKSGLKKVLVIGSGLSLIHI